MESERPKKQHRPSQEGPEEVLRRLERRLDEASAAAERLIAEAAHAAASARSNEAARSASGSSGPVGAGEPRSAESAGSGAGTGGDYRTPRAGWRTPEPGDGADRAVDLEPVLALLRSLRDLIPPELQRRLAEALRELLVALRALIDWYLERLEGRRTTAPDVQDIPIL